MLIGYVDKIQEVMKDVNDFQSKEFLEQFDAHNRASINTINDILPFKDCVTKVRAYTRLVELTLTELNFNFTTLIFNYALSTHIKNGVANILAEYHLSYEEYSEVLLEYLKNLSIESFKWKCQTLRKAPLELIIFNLESLDERFQQTFSQYYQPFEQPMLFPSHLEELKEFTSSICHKNYGWTKEELAEAVLKTKEETAQ